MPNKSLKNSFLKVRVHHERARLWLTIQYSGLEEAFKIQHILMHYLHYCQQNHLSNWILAKNKRFKEKLIHS